MKLLLALLLLVVPGTAFWSLLRGLDPVGRLVVSIAAGIVLIAATAQTMLILGTWSLHGGLVALGALSALLALSGRVHRRRQPPPAALPPRPVPAGANVTRQDLRLPRKEEEDDDWLFKE
ncbi:hypothetical protein GCM10009678_10950 [Actinomadura kijaniata]|uniref:Uncharacterized protein n=1 Tax=Actinomadura namibiensis TaxID=182080 RepID=A0A7W3QJA7_ACTNM|nr:hypothetical protein [Actinomadura namibiensis]MBA8949165.1 hypothetical protein [Actinomadura namibiensis]